MGVVQHPARAAGRLPAYRLDGCVAGELARGHAAVLETPHDAPRVARGVDLHDARARVGVQRHVAHVRSRGRHQEELTAQVGDLHA